VTFGNDADEYLTREPLDDHHQSLFENGQRRLEELSVAITHFKFLKAAAFSRFSDFRRADPENQPKRYQPQRSWASRNPGCLFRFDGQSAFSRIAFRPVQSQSSLGSQSQMSTEPLMLEKILKAASWLGIFGKPFRATWILVRAKKTRQIKEQSRL
jgi:hypothetical protein